MGNQFDSIIIGGGQAGLSVAYFLRRSKLNFLILDDRKEAGGAWQGTWDSLRLFSPSQFSSLSGWLMPPGPDEYPSKDYLLNYLRRYEERYKFPTKRNTQVRDVRKKGDLFQVITNRGDFFCRSLVSATGTAKNPFIPNYIGRDIFKGKQIHSVEYRNTQGLESKNVLVVGGGNSGAQILSEVSKVAKTKWITLENPNFLPEEIDGRYLFNAATEKYLSGNTAQKKTKASLSDIVQVESVKEGLARGIYDSYRPFDSFYEQGIVWPDGSKEEFDVVIWCTGFKPDLDHLDSLGLTANHKIKTQDTHSIDEPGLWLVGYANWTGYASATLYGVGKTAKKTATEIREYLEKTKV